MPVLILLVLAALLVGAVVLGLWWGNQQKGIPEAGRNHSKPISNRVDTRER